MSRAWFGSWYSTRGTLRPSSYTSEVTEVSEHSRQRGSCHSGRPSTARRVTQIGSWCETSTDSAPGPSAATASPRSRSTTASIRAACARYGSPQDGRRGLRSRGHSRGFRFSDAATWDMPSKAFSASIRSGSVTSGRSNAAAMGAAVCCARVSGEAATTAGARPVCAARSANHAATPRAISWPSSESPNSGRRP